jgi:hypothetical protein
MSNSSILVEYTPQEAIKSREGRGNQSYPYVEWSWVNSVLVKATQNHYDFQSQCEIVRVDDQPEMRYDSTRKRKVPVLDSAGVPKMIPQPPVLVCHGALTLFDYSFPEGQQKLGTRENYGSAVLMGPADQWGDMYKSATSDCLKKCAQLFGVALDLAGDLDQRVYEDEPEVQAVLPQEIVVVAAPAAPAVVTVAAPVQSVIVDDTNATDFEEDDINTLRDFLDSLGIGPDTEEELIRVIEDYSGGQYHEFGDINPGNVKSFNRYLSDLLNTGAPN